MFHELGFGLLGLGFVGVALASVLSAIVSVAYPVMVIWMIIDGFLRTDAEYPGTDPNRKVLWVVLMVLLHPVAIAYFFVVFLKIKRGSLAQAPQPYCPPTQAV